MDYYKCPNYRNYDFNVNALYDMREDTTHKKLEFYLSPYGSTCFQFTLKQDTGGGVVGTTILRRYGTFCCFLSIQNSLSASHSVSLWASSSSPFPIGFLFSFLPLIRSLSQSKSFYYLTAASLSALFGILLVFFFLIKRYGSNNAAMGVAAVTYSIGLTSFFRHWFLQVFWTFFLNHYQLVLVYMAVFAFIGVLLVRLKVFSEPKSQPTSLFDTVRWALKVISVTLILNSTASVMLSLLSYPVFFVLMKRINVVTSRLFA